MIHHYKPHRFTFSSLQACSFIFSVIVFYFEETRPATEEEKVRRAQEFEKNWKELKLKAKKFEKKSEEIAKEAESEIQKRVLFSQVFLFMP